MTELSPNFICICGHRNKMHVTTKEYTDGDRRVCIEFKDVVYVKNNWYHLGEQICSCSSFTPDNLRTLETMSEKVVQETQV